MKLYNLKPSEHIGPPCGSVALSVLNGKHPYKNVCDILKYRKTQKPYKDEFIYNLDNFYFDQNIIYFREILHFFSPYFYSKSKIIWLKKKMSVLQFSELLNPKHTYLIASTIHLQVVRNNKIWDTAGTNVPIVNNEFNNETVKWFVRLK